MLNNRLLCRTARNSSRGGFTLVELLVVIGIIAILAAVALGPITNGIRQAKHNASMQLARQLGQVEFSYATDNVINGNVYPSGATSEAIANQLVTLSYIADPSIFCVSGSLGGQTNFVGTPVVIAANNIMWNFTVVSVSPSTGGCTTATSDLVPLVYFTGGTLGGAWPFVPGTAATEVLSATKSPFGLDGIAVFYKGNNAAYLKAGSVTAGTVSNFISADCADTITYKEIVP